MKEKQDKLGSLKFQQLIKSGKDLHDSLSFASIYKNTLPENCQLVGNHIEVRNKKGVLMRRKSIVEDDGHDPVE